MKTRRIAGRRRAGVSLAVSMALFGGTAAVLGGPTASAALPGEDCTQAFPVAELNQGDEVTGLTVVSGTTPTGFTGEVLGVLTDGIAPGLDMIMADLEMPEFARTGGIWRGMSGSPVYAQDGRLIGAVAYGLSWGSSPIAGITPFEEMDDYLPDPPVVVKVGDRTARAIAARTDVTAKQAQQGFRQLRMPMGMAGVKADRLQAARKLQKERRVQYLPKVGFGVAGGSGSVDAGPETIVAGGNLAISESYGDITYGGIGTATSVCEGSVVGFGHPATFLGETTLSMHPADALFVQPDPLGAPFKVANFGAPVGTIDGDHLSGVSGTFGALPETTTITSDLTYKARNRVGSSYVSVPDANPSVTFSQQLANHDRVLDAIVKGSELMTWTIEGTDESGDPFEIGMTDRYASEYDIAFEAPWEVADTVWMLSSIPGVTVDDVSIDAEVVDDASVWRVKGVEYKRGGEWVKASRRKRVVANAGDQLKLRALLETTGNATTYLPLSLAIPQKAAGYRGGVQVEGGSSVWPGYRFSSVDDVQKLVERTVRNDAVQGEVRLWGRRQDLTRRVQSAPMDKVVRGGKYFSLKVVR